MGISVEVATGTEPETREPRLNVVEEYVERAATPQQLVELFSDVVWKFVSSQISRREDAEDIVMEVFAAAVGNFERVARAGDQRLWLLCIARRKVAGALRLRYRRAEHPLDDAHPAGQSTEIQAEVRAAVRSLPPAHAEALVLKYVNGLSTKEVSRVMRKSLPATNSLLQRARGTLRDAMGPAFISTGATK